MNNQFSIQELNVKNAYLPEYQALRKLMDVVHKERQPDDLVVPLEETINQMKNLPSFVDLKMWCVWDEEHAHLLAQGNVGLMHTEDNKHLVTPSMYSRKKRASLLGIPRLFGMLIVQKSYARI